MPITSNDCHEVRAWIEGAWSCVEGLAGPLSQTGEPYVVISVIRETEEEARSAAIDAFIAYADGRAGCLYWRIYPEVLVERDGRRKVAERWKVYMRLLISDKPVLPLATLAAQAPPASAQRPTFNPDTLLRDIKRLMDDDLGDSRDERIQVLVMALASEFERVRPS